MNVIKQINVAVLLLWAGSLCAQNENLVLNEAMSGATYHLQATVSIQMIPGFSFKADQQHAFHAEVGVNTILMDEKNESLQVAVYPNPGSDFLQVTTTLNKPRFELFNATGNVVFSEALQSNKSTILTRHLPAGHYTWRLYNQKQSESGVWIKK